MMSLEFVGNAYDFAGRLYPNDVEDVLIEREPTTTPVPAPKVSTKASLSDFFE
jgi:hypothetical protein